MAGPTTQQLWFERLYAWLRLPFWVGALVFGALVFVLLDLASFYLTGHWDVFLGTSTFAYFAVYASAAAVYAQFLARNATREVVALNAHLGSMNRGRQLDLKPLWSVRYFLILYLMMVVPLQLLNVYFGGLPESIPPDQRLLVGIPLYYWVAFPATFVWVWMYCLYSIFKMGRLDLRLQPFTEDRTLGLKPLGRFALRLSGMYIALLIIVIIPNLFIGLSSLPFLVVYAGFFLLALVFFFLPLLPLRGQLLRAKRDLLRRVGIRYTHVFERIDLGSEGHIEQEAVNELAAIDKIQRDVQQIHTWPFDVGIVVRLSAIILSVIAIILARIITITFGI